MPYISEWQSIRLLQRFWGRLSMAEYDKATHDAADDPRFPDLRLLLNDLTCVEAHEFSAATLALQFARQAPWTARNPRLRVAFVSSNKAVQDAVAGGLAAVPAYRWPTRAFSTLLRALLWGDADSPSLPAAQPPHGGAGPGVG